MDTRSETARRDAKLILLVDDEPACRIAIEAAVRDAGHRVHSAESRQEAMEAVSRYAYDLVLLDNRLSGTDSTHDGLDLLCAIRGRCRETKVILITGYGSPQLSAAARELGASAYLEKPVGLSRIVAEFARLGVAMDARTGSGGA